MNFPTAIRTVFAKTFTYSGRAPRSEYWWFYLFSVITSFVIGFAESLLGFAKWSADPAHPLFGVAEGPLSLVLMVVLTPPTYAVIARRLHDINASGWWVLISVATLLALPFMGGFMRQMQVMQLGQAPDWAALTPYLVAGGIWLLAAIGLLICLVRRGTQGSNRFGPDPLQPADLAETFR